MGFFDLFKKEKVEQPKETNVEVSTRKDNSYMYFPTIKGADDSKIIAEYFDDKANFRKFYDTTRIIIDTMPISVLEKRVYSAKVSWFGQNDAVYINDDGELGGGRREDYTDVMLKIDIDKLYRDPVYQRALMTELLDQKRVQKYMQRGLSENPDLECGNYIGEISVNPETGEYRKTFDTSVGKAIHQSLEMQTRRQNYRESVQRARQDAREAEERRHAEAMARLDEKDI